MTLSTLIAVTASLTFTLILAPSPLFLGLWVMLIALLMSLLLSLSTATWLGLFMFLIYVGGLLVMFAYFVALTPNLILGTLSIFLNLTMSTMLLLMVLNMFKISSTTSPQATTHFNMYALTLTTNAPALITLALVLFIALVAVVKICSHSSSPLRPFN